MQETKRLTFGIVAHRHTHKQPLPHAHPHSLSLNTYRCTHTHKHTNTHASIHTQALTYTIMLTHAHTPHAYTHVRTCTLTFPCTYVHPPSTLHSGPGTDADTYTYKQPILPPMPILGQNLCKKCTHTYTNMHACIHTRTHAHTSTIAQRCICTHLAYRKWSFCSTEKVHTYKLKVVTQRAAQTRSLVIYWGRR